MNIRRLVSEIHRRSIWQLLLIYLVSSWVALEVSQAIAERHQLPPWFNIFFIVLLIIGLPVVITTAFIQRGFPRKMGLDRASAAAQSATHVEASDSERKAGNTQRLFTWRNTILGGVAAFTLWAIVAAGWLYLADRLVTEIQQEPVADETVDPGRP